MNLATLAISFGVAVKEIVPLAESIVNFALAEIIEVIAFSIFPQSSISAVLDNDSSEFPPSPSADPPTLTERDGFVGRLYKTKVRVMFL